MGADRGPDEIVAGAKQAQSSTVQPLVVGPSDLDTQGLELIEASEVIGMDEKPTDAVRAKRDSFQTRITVKGRGFCLARPIIRWNSGRSAVRALSASSTNCSTTRQPSLSAC